eukprot:Gb_04814 [translate_table: standard]
MLGDGAQMLDVVWWFNVNLKRCECRGLDVMNIGNAVSMDCSRRRHASGGRSLLLHKLSLPNQELCIIYLHRLGLSSPATVSKLLWCVAVSNLLGHCCRRMQALPQKSGLYPADDISRYPSPYISLWHDMV